MKLEHIRQNHRSELCKHITTLLEKLKHSNTSPTKEVLEKEFNETWETWKKEICVDQGKLYYKDDQIECDISEILEDLCKRDGYVLLPKLCQSLRE